MSEVVYWNGDPTTAMEVEDFACFICSADEELFWCEWCGEWECHDHRCCPDCGGNLRGGSPFQEACGCPNSELT